MMGTVQYKVEFWLIMAVVLLTVLGFWDIYFTAEAEPQPHHHLHLITDFAWLGLLLTQLTLFTKGSYAAHRKLGLTVLLVGPLLVATSAMLSVHSAHKGVVSGEGDMLIVQNVMITLELGLIIFLAFLLKDRRKLHGSLLLSTTILFMGIALFFTLISFVPMFEIRGPETFYRFGTASMAGQIVCFIVGLLLYLRDRRNGWPFLIAGTCHALNEAISQSLTALGGIDALTRFVGSLSQPMTFAATFALLFVVLTATALPTARGNRAARQGGV
jgi:hypothetical protein